MGCLEPWEVLGFPLLLFRPIGQLLGIAHSVLQSGGRGALQRSPGVAIFKELVPAVFLRTL